MKNWIILATLMAVPAATFASNDIDPLLWGCSEIGDDDKRLACFDAYIKQKTAQKAPKSSKPAPLVLNSNGDDAVETVKAIPKQETPQQFGLEHKKTEEEKQVSEITSSLLKVSKQAHNNWVFTLDNGQKWRTVESTSSKYKSGQDVIISRGMFNSFSLKKTGSNRTVKVKRIK